MDSQSYIVVLKDPMQAESVELETLHLGGEIINRFSIIPAFEANLSKVAVEKLKNDSRVDYIESNSDVYAF
ncbi:408_t:CDS:2 [Ambispora gerdemannii]|uniref:408_t:CDS:1 n=1 Tax=Ambispora gerdemannii TaxID=144530 RepID=A0A9N9DJ39_9GLOM|nr:408_t:CDS:2 [Ambispora gerdemannii]